MKGALKRLALKPGTKAAWELWFSAALVFGRRVASLADIYSVLARTRASRQVLGGSAGSGLRERLPGLQEGEEVRRWVMPLVTTGLC